MSLVQHLKVTLRRNGCFMEMIKLPVLLTITSDDYQSLIM